MKTNRKGIIVAVLCGVLLVGYTAAALLLKLVISTDAKAESEAVIAVDNATGTANTYSGPFNSSLGDEYALMEDGQTNIVTLRKFRWQWSNIYVADIYVSSPQEIKTAFAKDTFGNRIFETISSMSARLGAKVCINGDYYSGHDSGYVIHNGVLYRNTVVDDVKHVEDLVIMNDGTFKIIKETEVTAEELMAQGAWQLMAFGPALINNGEVLITEDNYQTGYVAGRNPRSAIGHISDLHYVMVMCEGRSTESLGLYMWDLANFMKLLGCDVAYNLDGGASANIAWEGKRLNELPSEVAGERTVSECLYVMAGN